MSVWCIAEYASLHVFKLTLAESRSHYKTIFLKIYQNKQQQHHIGRCWEVLYLEGGVVKLLDLVTCKLDLQTSQINILTVFVLHFFTRRLNKNKLQVLPELLFQGTPKLSRLWVTKMFILPFPKEIVLWINLIDKMAVYWEKKCLQCFCSIDQSMPCLFELVDLSSN